MSLVREYSMDDVSAMTQTCNCCSITDAAMNNYNRDVNVDCFL